MASTFQFLALFLAFVSAVDAQQSGCGFSDLNMIPNANYYIYSPLFPDPYPSQRLRCSYQFVAPSNFRIKLKCNILDILYTDTCEYSVFKFSPSGDIFFSDMMYDCGSFSNVELESTGNMLAAEFENNYYNSYSQLGYNCTVRAEEDNVPPATTTTTTTTAPSTTSTTTTAPTTTTTTAPTTTTTTAPTTTTTAPSTTTTTTTTAPTTTTTAPSTTTTTAPPTTTTTAPPTTTKPSSPNDCSCGILNSGSRIVGGEETAVNKYPHHVGIIFITSGSAFCGGSLISDQWVLTASHCIVDFEVDQLGVSLGDHDVSSTTETNSYGEFVLEKYTHENYDVETVDNDIGLLKLQARVPITSAISPICLPYSFVDTDLNGELATVIGWGTVEFQGAASSVLQEVDLPIVSKSECEKFPVMQGVLTDSMFCTYEEGKDACRGDSGGSLVYNTNGRLTLIGLVSFGFECAKKDQPGVYTKVANYLDWIEERTGESFCKQ